MKKLFLLIGIGLFFALLTSSCENNGNTFSGNVPNEEYELWNIIPQQSIETFALSITEIPLYKYTTSEYIIIYTHILKRSILKKLGYPYNSSKIWIKTNDADFL